MCTNSRCRKSDICPMLILDQIAWLYHAIFNNFQLLINIFKKIRLVCIRTLFNSSSNVCQRIWKVAFDRNGVTIKQPWQKMVTVISNIINRDVLFPSRCERNNDVIEFLVASPMSSFDSEWLMAFVVSTACSGCCLFEDDTSEGVLWRFSLGVFVSLGWSAASTMNWLQIYQIWWRKNTKINKKLNSHLSLSHSQKHTQNK